MSNIVQRLREARRIDHKLSTGRLVSYHLPDVEECLLQVGEIPLPALTSLVTAQEGSEPTEAEAFEQITSSPDAYRKLVQYQRLVVATMLDAVEGEEVDPDDDRLAIVEMLDPAERTELFLIGTRQKDPDTGEA